MVFICISKAFVLNNEKNDTLDGRYGLNSDLKNDSGKYFLWEIQGSSSSYLFGTIHVPFNRIWDSIPDNMMQAFNNSQQIYLELDMDEKTLSKLVRCEKLPDGLKVNEVLPKPLYLKWKAYLEYLHHKIASWITPWQKSQGLTADIIFSWLFENWETRRPIWTLLKTQMVIKTYITSIEYLTLDTYLAEIGRRFGKLVGGIEHVEETCAIFNDLNDSQVLFIMNKTMELDHELLTQITTNNLNDLIDRYKRGILSPAYFSNKFGFFPQIANSKNGTTRVSISINNEEERQLAADLTVYLRNHILFKRNKVMADRIIKLIQNNPDTSFFFAFGVGHFIGQNSVVDIIRQRNISIERVTPETSIKSTRSSDIRKNSYNCDCDNFESFSWIVCVIKCAFGF